MNEERRGAKASVDRLLAAIGYPERVPGGGAFSRILVDGMEVFVEESEGRVILSHVLSGDESMLPTLAAYASGRMLKEDAALAYGEPVPGESSAAFLWQSAPAGSDSRALVRLFETFMNSCDWWRERVAALRGGEESSPPETMMIRP